jgi:hypothetical protein
MTKPDAKSYFSVYEGNRSGKSSPSSKGWQNNLPTESYMDEIREVFPHVERRGKVIIGHKFKPTMRDGGVPGDKAESLGFSHDYYHATRATQPFNKFNVVAGTVKHELPGVHIGTLKAAQDRLEDYYGVKDWGKTKDFTAVGDQERPSIMPLKVKLEKPYVKKNGSPFTETELRSKVNSFAKKNNFLGKRDPQIQFAKMLLQQGFDHVPYVNTVEDKGNVSILHLKPQNIRSKYAEFNPERANENNIMAADGGFIRPQRHTGGRIPEMDKLFKQAKKYIDSHTKSILSTPDDVVVKALRVAQKRI